MPEQAGAEHAEPARVEAVERSDRRRSGSGSCGHCLTSSTNLLRDVNRCPHTTLDDVDARAAQSRAASLRRRSRGRGRAAARGGAGRAAATPTSSRSGSRAAYSARGCAELEGADGRHHAAARPLRFIRPGRAREHAGGRLAGRRAAVVRLARARSRRSSPATSRSCRFAAPPAPRPAAPLPWSASARLLRARRAAVRAHLRRVLTRTRVEP